ncbi:MAG: neutral/alkaline non-lysosomal ceramidase N-terminal domain-containing protein [bacterium]|jgi:hypothetical protein|nr:neutral/alkaline non-lysosomal ceramidase N-terminal domain-containing protein [bacterium]
MRVIKTPMSRVLFGLSRQDITPPTGIYHPLWGAARHHQATGIHRGLTTEIMAFASASSEKRDPFIRVQMDACGFVDPEYHDRLIRAVSEGAGVPTERVVLAVSHTHSACFPVKNRRHLPGGNLIDPYIESLCSQVRIGASEAVQGLEEVVISYAFGRCSMAANRDYWDEDYNGFTCGYNPDLDADDTVVVARMTDRKGGCISTLVNYACHPTTLAWENTLISPDFVGAMRETVEKETRAPCIFAQGACGDLGPREGFVGDPAVADRNGRQLGFAALSALNALGAPERDFSYQGAVISGATLGTWSQVEATGVRMDAISEFSTTVFTVDLPYILLPTLEELEARIELWKDKQRQADQIGDSLSARDAGAQAERALRWAGKIVDLPVGKAYAMSCAVLRMGDAVWVTTGGEPYNSIQRALRERFPQVTLVFTPLTGPMNVGYLLSEACYGQGRYQEQPSVLAKGCLELLLAAVGEKIASILS